MEFKLDLKVNADKPVSLTTRMFLTLEDTKTTGRIWGFELGREQKRYREQKGLVTHKFFDDCMHKDALSVATKATDFLEKLTVEITIKLWG